jgi:Alpha-tubulin suppressor and related RCC1 domain-containing proteins
VNITVEITAGRRRWISTAAGSVVLALALGACGAPRDESAARAPVAKSAAMPDPPAVPQSSVAVSISVGMSHVCAAMSDGQVWCWGGNEGGQLGAVADSDSSSAAVRVEAAPSFTAVAAGGAHSCALAKDGTIWCWGANPNGQLGDGTMKSRTHPAVVAGTGRFTAVAAGVSHSCALDATGAAWCWGANQLGQLGNAGTTSSRVPLRVSDGMRFRALAAGGAATCGIATDATMWCWGASPVGHGEGGGALHASTPVEVPSLRGAESLSLAPSLACAVTAAHGVLCAGDNSAGQLGNGAADEMLSQHPDPTPVSFPDGVTIAKVAAGEGHACAIAIDGHAWCWGSGASGEIGDSPLLSRCTAGTGTIPCAKHPVAVAADRVFRAISAGREESCGITRDGRVVCWGGELDHRGVREIAVGAR